MANSIYVGVSNKARKVNKLYVGVSNVAKQVKKVYVGVNNVARLVYTGVPVSIPTMTSNTTPSGTASCSSIYQNSSDHDAWKAFDKNSSTTWQGKIYANDNERWVKYDFGYSVIPSSISVTQDSSYEHTYMIEGSKNNSTWVTLVDGSGLLQPAEVNQEIQNNWKNSYRYYRWICFDSASTRTAIKEFSVSGYKV